MPSVWQTRLNMPFPELEQYKRQSPRLADLLSHLEVYLGEVLDRPIRRERGLDHAAFDIVPSLVAQKLGVDENLALVLLREAEKAEILDHRYDVYCPNTDNFIATFKSEDDLPASIRCRDEERTEHSINEYFVELVFYFAPKFVQEHNLAMSM